MSCSRSHSLQLSENETLAAHMNPGSHSHFSGVVLVQFWTTLRWFPETDKKIEFSHSWRWLTSACTKSSQLWESVNISEVRRTQSVSYLVSSLWSRAHTEVHCSAPSCNFLHGRVRTRYKTLQIYLSEQNRKLKIKTGWRTGTRPAYGPHVHDN